MAVFYYYCKLSTFKSMLHSKTLWLTDLTKSKELEADGLYSFELEEEEHICRPAEQED